MALIATLERWFAYAMRLFASFCFLGIALMVVARILSRGAAKLPDPLFDSPVFAVAASSAAIAFFEGLAAAWFDEIFQLLATWMVLIGAAALWRDNDHFRANFIDNILGPRARALVALLTMLFALAFFLVLSYYGWLLVDRTITKTSILQLPRSWWIASVPVASAIMATYAAWDAVSSALWLISGVERHR